MAKVPQEGGRGFTLAKWGFVLGAAVVLMANIHLYLGTIDADGFITATLIGSGLAGIGSGGHQLSNITERWTGSGLRAPKE